MIRIRTTVAVALAAGTVAFAGCAAGTERPGAPSVYEGISSLQSCAAAQEAFDTYMGHAERLPAGTGKRDAPLAYAEAVNDRMEALGC